MGILLDTLRGILPTNIFFLEFYRSRFSWNASSLVMASLQSTYFFR